MYYCKYTYRIIVVSKLTNFSCFHISIQIFSNYGALLGDSLRHWLSPDDVEVLSAYQLECLNEPFFNAGLREKIFVTQASTFDKRIHSAC